jgi:hypothetical protein
MYSIEVRLILPCRSHVLADLVEAGGCEPAFAAAALDGNAIGLDLVRPDTLVGAFVAEYPQLHRRRETGEQVRIENQEAANGGPEISQVGVEHRGIGAARHAATVDLQHATRRERPTVRGNVCFRARIALKAIERLRRARTAQERNRHADIEPWCRSD